MSAIYDIGGTSNDCFSINGKANILQGDDDPKNYQGQNGDIYLQSKGKLWSKRNDVWQSVESSTADWGLPSKDNQLVIASPSESGLKVSYSDITANDFENIAFKNKANDFVGKNTVPTPTLNDTKQIANVEFVKTNLNLAVPAGTVIMYGSNTAPNGYIACNGAAISRTTYASLFNVIGTTFGAGNGSTTFNLPDFNNRFAYGSNGSNLGSKGGEATHTLTINEMPSHTHTMNTLNVTAYDKTYKSGSLAQGTLSPVQSSATGGNQPHNNIPPYTAIRFYIKY